MKLNIHWLQPVIKSVKPVHYCPSSYRIEGNMKIFKSVRVYFRMLGVDADHSIQSNPFNAKNLLVFIVFILSIISNFVYILNYANSFEEYTNCINTVSTVFIGITVFGILVWKMRELFEFIQCLENAIQNS